MISLAGWLITSASPDIIFSTKLLVIQPLQITQSRIITNGGSMTLEIGAPIIEEFVVGGRKIFGKFACSDTDIWLLFSLHWPGPGLWPASEVLHNHPVSEESEASWHLTRHSPHCPVIILHGHSHSAMWTMSHPALSYHCTLPWEHPHITPPPLNMETCERPNTVLSVTQYSLKLLQDWVWWYLQLL